MHNRVKRLPCGTVLLGALLLSPSVHAQLVPDFTSDTTGLPIGPDGSGQTPFIDEIVSDPATGFSYHHLLLGSLADGFAQDVYIRTANTYFPNGGVGSASGGFNTGGGDVFGTGNGTNTGNPTSIIMRQLLNDGELAEEFLKDQTDKKPHITQLINAPDITTMFDADMSNSTYSDNTTPGTVINTLMLVDPNIPVVGAGDFSMIFDGVTTTMEAGGQATQDQNVLITAGRYTYTIGFGPGGSGGTYTYWDSTFDPFAIDAASYFDKSQANPWSNPTNKPN